MSKQYEANRLQIHMEKQLYRIVFESGCDWLTWATSKADALAQAEDCVPSEIPAYVGLESESA